MKIINRLLQYLDYKQIKPTAFEKIIGLSNGYLGVQKKRNADIGEGVLLKIIDNSLDLSPNWLLTGEGEMLKISEPQQQQIESDTIIIHKEVWGVIKSQADSLQCRDNQIDELIDLLKQQVSDAKKMDARKGDNATSADVG